MESCPVYMQKNWTLEQYKLNNDKVLMNTTYGNFLY